MKARLRVLLGVLGVLVVALPAGRATAEPRVLTLADAVELALRVDPLMESALVDRDRSKLSVLRSQLDRITFKIDGSLQELWNKANLAGPTIGSCAVAGVSFGASESTCANAGGAYTAAAEQSPSGAQGLFNLSANLNVPIFAGFRIDATVKRAQRYEEAAIVQVRRQRRDIALAAARTFWSVRRLELLRDAQRGAVARLIDAEGVASARVKAGLAPPIDKNRAVFKRLQRLATVRDYEGQIKEALASLGVSLGIKEDYRLEAGFTFPEEVPADPAQLVATARHDRPELAIARLQLDAQRQAIRIARSGYYPTLGVFGLFQYGNNQFSVGTGARDVSAAGNPFAGLSGTLTLGATANMNFFNMLNTYTASRDAEYEAARLVAEQRRAERAVDADVMSGYAKVARLFGVRGPLKEALELARDNVRIIEARYKSGEALVFEMLEAQNDITQAEASLIDVEAQLELAWVELRAALGEPPGRRP